LVASATRDLSRSRPFYAGHPLMALYDAPVHTGYKILTHNSTRRFAQNGFGQVGNTTVPTNPVNPTPVMKSAIYNKNLSLRGISEAGYGKRYPFYGLSYSGAGSPALRYAGGGSPRTSLAYPGAGSPRWSLADAYINDNPPPGTLRVRGLRGLADDTAVPVDTGTTLGPQAPTVDTSGGILSSLSNAFSLLTSTLVQTTATTGTLAANNAVANAITGTPSTSTSTQIAAGLKTATNPKTLLGVSVDTLMLIGIGVGAYYFLRK
jgi:hypothetical protein